jgi:phosphatidylinositol 3-kinase
MRANDNIKPTNSTMTERFFLSSDVPLNVKVKVGSLVGRVVPLAPLHSVAHTSARHSPLYDRSQREFVVECTLFADAQPLLPSVRTAHRASDKDAAAAFDEWFTFAVAYAHLPLSAALAFTVFTSDGVLLGGSTLPLFRRRKSMASSASSSSSAAQAEYSLRRGSQRLLVWRGCVADGAAVSSTPHKLASGGERDRRAQLELFRKRHHRKKHVHVAWLDELMQAELAAVEADLAQRELAQTDQLVLTVALPEFEFPILFHQAPYESAAGVLATPPLAAASPTGVAPSAPATGASAAAAATATSGVSSAAAAAATSTAAALVVDPEMWMPNPIELAHVKISRGTRLARADRELKPLTSELEQLNRIVGYPPTQALTESEKQLLWQFRYHLSTRASALTKFLKAVDWSDASEAERAVDLMHQWEPIDIADALELLSKSFTHEAVRKYAVERLKPASDDDLGLYLLQLVQALAYERDIESSPLIQFIVRRAARSIVLANFLQWYLWVEANGATGTRRTIFADVLLAFRNHLKEAVVDDMIARAEKQPLAPAAPRRRRSDMNGGGGAADHESSESNPVSGGDHRESPVAPALGGNGDDDDNNNNNDTDDAYRATSPSSGRGGGDASAAAAPAASIARDWHGVFSRQRRLVKSISDVAREIKELRMARPQKIEKLRELLIKHELHEFAPVPLPLDPTVVVCGINPATVTVYKSAMQPLGLEFRTVAGGSYYAIFKSGDDLRQDQFVIQLIRLMDRVLKREQLDLRITPYAVLATSADEGFVQRVNDCQGVATVLKTYGGDIGRFLRERTEKGGVDALDAFVKSCAGYSAITYILMIGDRHLDNLLLTDDGRLFHIDFGFILGRDPKPYPPPMKIIREMVDGMGGASSLHYQQFKSLSCEAFHLLRQSSSLFLNLFALMRDSAVPDVVLEGDGAVLKVQEKMRLELTPEEAEVAFQQLINESVSNIYATFFETGHRIAQFLRS